MNSTVFGGIGAQGRKVLAEPFQWVCQLSHAHGPRCLAGVSIEHWQTAFDGLNNSIPYLGIEPLPSPSLHTGGLGR